MKDSLPEASAGRGAFLIEGYCVLSATRVSLHRQKRRRVGGLTEVVLTPYVSEDGSGEGAAGVSMNSKSSEDSENVLDILAVYLTRYTPHSIQ